MICITTEIQWNMVCVDVVFTFITSVMSSILIYRPWSVLYVLHLKSAPFSKRFVLLPNRFVFNTFRSAPKRSVSFSKRCFVPYKTFKLVRTKRSVQSVRKSSGVFVVIIKMANWQWSRKLPFIWRIILLFHILGLVLWNCFYTQNYFELELHLQDKSSGVLLHHRM